MNETMSFNDYLDCMVSGLFRPYCRIEILRNLDESVQSSIIKLPLDGSSLTANCGNGSVRSVSLVLDNSAGDFLPSPDSINIGMKFQLYLGCSDAQGRTIEFPQGVFCLAKSDPQIASLYSSQTVTINATDKWDLLDVPVGYIYQIPKGSSIVNAVASILQLCGDCKAPIIESLPLDLSPYDLKWDVTATYSGILKDLANLFSREILYSATGNLIFRTFNDQTTNEIQYEFNTNNCVYQGNTRTLKYSEMCNHIYVIGATANSETYRGEAINKDLTSNSNIFVAGDRSEVIQDTNLSSNDLCNQRAEFELSQKKRFQENISLNCMCLFHMDINKSILVTDAHAGQDRKKYVVQQFSIPLNGKSAMSITAYLFSDMTDFEDRLSVTATSATA